MSGELNADPFALARQTGFDEGYSMAQAERETAVEAERHRVRVALMGAAASAAQTRVEAVASITSEVVELALELTEVLVQRELRQSDAGVEAVKRALRLAPTGDDLVVRLHPDDAIEIDQVEMLAPGVSVKVIADPAIERGGCVLEVGPCHIDTQVGPALGGAGAVIAAEADAPAEDQSSVAHVLCGRGCAPRLHRNGPVA